MNERIRKIAIETDAWCDQHYTGDQMYNIKWEQKFAELIVRECAVWVNDNLGLVDEEARKDLLKHFGVEE